MLIENCEPNTWQELEDWVTRILSEAGFRAQRGWALETVRGSVNVDVVAFDDVITPPALTLFECKYWKERVTQTVVHAFRTIVMDSGANTGLIVSRRGFQSGAEAAAQFSNIRLLDWYEFQELYAERWISKYMNRQVSSALDPLYEYTGLSNRGISQKADALPQPARDEFRRLREKHSAAVTTLTVMFSDVVLGIIRGPLSLPLRTVTLDYGRDAMFPNSILDAPGLRPLLQAIIEYATSTTKSFDDVFGGRA
jgi:restriction system protein